MFSISPVRRLSITMTWYPSSMKRSTRWDPRKPAPPVINTRFCGEYSLVVDRVFFAGIDDVTADGIVVEPKFFHGVQTVDVPSVKDHRRFQQGFDLFEVRGTEFIPLGNDAEGICAFECFVLIVHEFHVEIGVFLDLFHGFGDRILSLLRRVSPSLQ